MPAQQCGRLHEQAPPGWAGQQPRESSKQGSVGPVDPWLGHLASQHRDLVAQHEQFGVLGCRTPRQQCEPPQHLADQQIEQSKGHAPIIAARWLPRRTCSSAPHDRFSGTHRLEPGEMAGPEDPSCAWTCCSSGPPLLPSSAVTLGPSRGRGACARLPPRPERSRRPWPGGRRGCARPGTGRSRLLDVSLNETSRHTVVDRPNAGSSRDHCRPWSCTCGAPFACQLPGSASTPPTGGCGQGTSRGTPWP
jgi:hypothetical protein